MCQGDIESAYYQFSGYNICASCAARVQAGRQRPPPAWVARGMLFGAGAAVACAIGYAIITAVFNAELALVAIGVGWVIGRAVRIGSHGLGGLRCQVLAVVLTYVAITASYIPLVARAIRQGPQTAQQGPYDPAPLPARMDTLPWLAVITGIALVSPFLELSQGVSGILGVIIIFVGLAQAWRLTARDARILTGPYPAEEPRPNG